MDDVSRTHTHTHIHNYSDFLIVTISVGLAQAHPSIIIIYLVSFLSLELTKLQVVVHLSVLGCHKSSYISRKSIHSSVRLDPRLPLAF